MGKLVLGLDIGITSVGWGLIDIETDEIVDKGVRLFPEGTAAENLKRRTKRGGRRLKRRRQQRIIDLKKLLKKHNIINDDFVALNNPYEIRVKGLSEQLTNEEFATAFLHIVKRRGSILDTIEDDESKLKDDQSTKAVLTSNEKYLRQKDYYICQLQLERLSNGENIRGTYNNFKTSDYLKEAEAIFKNQEITNDLKKDILELIARKREYYDGPGSKNSPTPYGQWFYDKNGKIKHMDMIEKMRGKCSIFSDEPCAPKMSYRADLFNFLNDLNNLKVDGEGITTEQKNEIINEYINKKGEISPKNLIKYLGVDEYLVTGFRIDKNDNSLLTEFKGYKKILSVLKKNNSPKLKEIVENKEYVDKIIDILTRVKGITDRVSAIQEIDPNLFEKEVAEQFANISGITGYHSISYKAMNIIIPELMATNDNQMQILTRTGLINKGKKSNLKGMKNIPFDDEAILSPVAKRAQNESLKVINAIRKQYGELDSIVIETARDRNSLEEQRKITESQKRGEELNKKCEVIAKGVKLNKVLRHKIRLYMEQDAKCLYSGRPIDLYRLLHDPKAYEIDHIIPISISLDDSMNNKVLVLSEYNHLKGNATPFKFLKSGKSSGWSYEEFKTYALALKKNNQISRKKLNNLLFEEEITKFSVRRKFIERNLVDTRYASRTILDTLTNYFNANSIDTKVHTVRGAITNIFRQKSGLIKNRDYFYHHIVDALIVAGIKKQGYLNKLLLENQIKYDEETGEVLNIVSENEFFDSGYIRFISKLKKLNDYIIYDGEYKISHKVDRKPNRQFTDETIYGVRSVDGEDKILSKYKNIYGDEGIKLAKDIRESKFDKILMSKVDPKTFELLKNIVYNTPIDKEKKELNPFEIYKNEHGYIRKVSRYNDGPIVKSVKYYLKRLKSHVDISHKYNLNTNKTKVALLQVSPYRTDFYKDSVGLYKFLTIRYANIYTNKDGYYINKQWYEDELNRRGINSDFEFQFSLNRNEFVEICKQEKDYRDMMLYRFVGTNSEEANKVEVKPLHFNTNKDNRIKITINKTIVNMTKYHSDVLGNLYKVEKEALKLKL
ncbi:MAG: type II CRISPR RNA-guided endonuclease Cas9 [Bacilli bacterium]|nr:type II CRISPR RNA-guided endonuclease Cas9 [Bacilli bacterium]